MAHKDAFLCEAIAVLTLAVWLARRARAERKSDEAHSH